MHELPAGSFARNYPKGTRKDIVSACVQATQQFGVILKKIKCIPSIQFLVLYVAVSDESDKLEDIENTSLVQIAVLYFHNMLSVQKLHLRTNTCSSHAIHDCHEATISYGKY